MPISNNIVDTKNNLPKYIYQAEAGKDICITRHGKAVAMLISIERYKSKFTEADSGLYGAIMAWRQQVTFDEDLLSDQTIDALRNKRPARDFSWD